MNRQTLVASLRALSSDEFDSVIAEARRMSADSQPAVYDRLLSRARKHRTALVCMAFVAAVVPFIVGYLGSSLQLEPLDFFINLKMAGALPFFGVVYMLFMGAMLCVSNFLDDLFPRLEEPHSPF